MLIFCANFCRSTHWTHLEKHHSINSPGGGGGGGGSLPVTPGLLIVMTKGEDSGTYLQVNSPTSQVSPVYPVSVQLHSTDPIVLTQTPLTHGSLPLLHSSTSVCREWYNSGY